MYGTLVRVRPTEGSEVALRALLEEQLSGHGEAIDGFVAQFLLVPDDGAGEVFGLIVFSSAEAYRRNAASPDQHRRFQAVRKLLDTDPVWIDGEIVPLEPTVVSL